MSEPSRVLPARRRGLADEVADRIREAVFAGVYRPGAALREVELAEALGVSRGPVREALLRLEREGLVRTTWHRGTTVTSLSPADIAEIDSLRDALEQLAVRRVVEQASAGELAAIEQAASRMAGAEDDHAMVICDLAFHDAVYAAAHHSRLADAWAGLRSQVHLFLLTRIGVDTDGYRAHIHAEHRELAAALRDRDAELALRLFAEHRAHAFELLSPVDERPGSR